MNRLSVAFLLILAEYYYTSINILNIKLKHNLSHSIQCKIIYIKGNAFRSQSKLFKIMFLRAELYLIMSLKYYIINIIDIKGIFTQYLF